MSDKNEIVSLEEKLEEEEKKQVDEEEQENEKQEKNKKHIKNVSVKQCIGTIIFSLFAFVVFLIPYTFGNSGMELTFSFLPLFGDGSILETPSFIAEGTATLFGINDIVDIFQLVFDLDTLIFLIILCFDILFSLILAISRSQILRKICKIITIFAGILMIIIMLASILQVVGIIGALITGVIESDSFMTELETCGVLFAVGMAIMSGMMIKRQFVWFAKLY